MSQYTVGKGGALHKNLWHYSFLDFKIWSLFVWCCYVNSHPILWEWWVVTCVPARRTSCLWNSNTKKPHNESMEKELVLCNLQELYVAFHEKLFNCFSWLLKILGIVSRTLHPCRCMVDPYSDTVCVCVIHQNITLMVQGAHVTADINPKNSWRNDVLNRKWNIL